MQEDFKVSNLLSLHNRQEHGNSTQDELTFPLRILILVSNLFCSLCIPHAQVFDFMT